MGRCMSASRRTCRRGSRSIEGAHDGFTKKHNVKRLVWYDLTDDMTAAIASEKRIKKWPRDWKKNLIERHNPAWEDLAIGLGFEPLA